MSSNQSGNPQYLRAEERIFEIATNKDALDWKGLLYKLIDEENLDPWNIDLGILTKKYLEKVKEIKEIKDLDFDISGKVLTIAVFLLKTKADSYIEHDLRGIDESIASFQNEGMELEGFEDLEMLEEQHSRKWKKKEKYEIKVRNPLARKRKVTIFDLFDVLEKTFEQSNKRRANFFARKAMDDYNGPLFEKKPKDLKLLIEELFEEISQELGEKKAHVTFSHLTRDKNHKKAVLEKFIPLLHLHNQSRVELKQKEHFSDIEIHKINKDRVEVKE